MLTFFHVTFYNISSSTHPSKSQIDIRLLKPGNHSNSGISRFRDVLYVTSRSPLDQFQGRLWKWLEKIRMREAFIKSKSLLSCFDHLRTNITCQSDSSQIFNSPRINFINLTTLCSLKMGVVMSKLLFSTVPTQTPRQPK